MKIPVQIQLKVRRLTPTAILPTRGSPEAIGLDLYADEAISLPAGERGVCKTNIAAAVQPGFYGRIAPRSGLAKKYGIDVLGGVIDQDYRGSIDVMLLNTGADPFSVARGDRIAQLIMERAKIMPVVEVDDLTETQRGAAGFGSTG